MKKIKQLAFILFLSVGLFSCEAEKSDEVIGNEYLPGKQIFRYEIDGVAKVTDDVTVSTTGAAISITAVFPNPESGYKKDTFTIQLNKLATGTYVSTVSGLVLDETYGIANASYKHHNVNWVYSTQNLEANINNAYLQLGSVNILSINDKAKYFEGDFEFDLYAPKAQNPNNTIPPVAIRKGYFQYVSYN